MDNNEWLCFLWNLHNKVRNAKGIKLTGISALNEISNFLLFFFMESKIIEHNLPDYCKFSYLYNNYANKQAYVDDHKQPELIKKNMYILWHTVYDINNNDNCVIKCLLKNEFFKKYLQCMTHKPSSYAVNNKAMQTIQECFTFIYDKLKEVTWSHDKFDMFGSAFEQFKEDAADKKVLGQHFTPPSIKNYIINELKPSYKNTFYDPCAGSGGFIHTATSYVYKNDTIEHYNKFKIRIYANECDPELTKTLMINMLLHDVPVTNIHERDSLDYNENCKDYLHKFDKIATNPPFGMKISHEFVDVEHYVNYWKPLIVSKKIIKDSTAQFILHILNSLKQNDGHTGIVIDRGFLNNGYDNVNSWETNFRKYILTNFNLYKIVLLPTGIFTYTNFATSIIFIKTGEKTKQVDFYIGKFSDPNNKKSNLITDTEPNLSININDIKTNNWSLKYDIDKPSDEINETDKQDADYYIELHKLIKLLPNPKHKAKDAILKGKYNYYTSSNVIKKSNFNDFNDEFIIIGSGGNGSIFIDSNFSCSADNFILQNIKDNIILQYLYYVLKLQYNILYKLYKGNGLKHLSKTDLLNYKVPLLLLPHQEEIIMFLNKTFEEHELKIDDFVKQIGKINIFKLLINQQYDEFSEIVFLVKQKLSYDRLLKNFEKEKQIIFKQKLNTVKTTKHKLSDLVNNIITGKSIKKEKRIGTKYPYYGANGIIGNVDEYILDGEYILTARNGTIGAVLLVNCKFYPSDHTFCITSTDNKIALNKYIYLHLLYITNFDKIKKHQGMPGITKRDVENLIIDLPILSDQELIVNEINKVNDKQHLFQQHTAIIEQALILALETVKNICANQDISNYTAVINNDEEENEAAEEDNISENTD